jgi:hypothetical protein
VFLIPKAVVKRRVIQVNWMSGGMGSPLLKYTHALSPMAIALERHNGVTKRMGKKGDLDMLLEN